MVMSNKRLIVCMINSFYMSEIISLKLSEEIVHIYILKMGIYMLEEIYTTQNYSCL